MYSLSGYFWKTYQLPIARNMVSLESEDTWLKELLKDLKHCKQETERVSKMAKRNFTYAGKWRKNSSVSFGKGAREETEGEKMGFVKEFAEMFSWSGSKLDPTCESFEGCSLP